MARGKGERSLCDNLEPCPPWVSFDRSGASARTVRCAFKKPHQRCRLRSKGPQAGSLEIDPQPAGLRVTQKIRPQSATSERCFATNRLPFCKSRSRPRIKTIILRDIGAPGRIATKHQYQRLSAKWETKTSHSVLGHTLAKFPTETPPLRSAPSNTALTTSGERGTPGKSEKCHLDAANNDSSRRPTFGQLQQWLLPKGKRDLELH